MQSNVLNDLAKAKRRRTKKKANLAGRFACRRCWRVSSRCVGFSMICLACEAKVFHTFCTLFFRFSHCQDRALERDRPQQRKKKASTILNWGGPFLLPAFSYLRSKSLEVLPRGILFHFHVLFFPSNARWLSPGRLSSRKDNCIVQIHRINAIATLVIMTMCVSFPCSRDTGVRDLVSNLFHPIFFVLLNFPRP